MALYEVKSDHLQTIEQTKFDVAGFLERSDLQRLLKRQMDVILPDILVIEEEFGQWEESKRRIDLLGLDRDANLVVIELKRTEDGGHMELQAIRYAAMVSTMTFEQVAESYGRFLAKEHDSETDARSAILDFLGWDRPNKESFAQEVRIVLVSANFSKELTTAVMWLNKSELDIRCIRVIPYQHDGKLLIDVQQIIPLPEAAEYQIRIKEKELEEKKDKTERNSLQFSFWSGLLDVARSKSDWHYNVSPASRDWISVKNIRGMRLNYVINQSDSRVELYIARGESELNKKTFDALASHKNEIEQSFGEDLSWERLDDRKASRLAFYVTGGYKNSEGDWETIQNQMVDAMIRLEKTISPLLNESTLIR